MCHTPPLLVSHCGQRELAADAPPPARTGDASHPVLSGRDGFETRPSRIRSET